MGTASAAGALATKEAALEEPTPLDEELKGALTQALEDLFADQAVVTMRDVRLWLQSYTANVKARMAALQSDSALSSLMLGGGCVVEIRYASSCRVFWLCFRLVRVSVDAVGNCHPGSYTMAVACCTCAAWS